MIDYGSSQSKKQYTRRIGDSGFLGADYSTAPIFASPRRFRDLKNVWKDYKSGSGVAIETIPGYREVFNNPVHSTDAGGNIIPNIFNGIHRFDVVSYGSDNKATIGFDMTGAWYCCHSYKFIYWIRENEIREATGDDYETAIVKTIYNKNRINAGILPNKKSVSYQINNALYVICGGEMFSIELATEDDIQSGLGVETRDIGFCIKDVNPYIPTTFIDGKPYEQKNMLTLLSKEIQTLDSVAVDTDYQKVEFYPHEKVKAESDSGLSDKKLHIKAFTVDGTDRLSACTVNDSNGYITKIVYSFAASSSSSHKIEIEYESEETKFTSYRSYEDYKDNRTFNEGNPDYKGTAYEAIAGCTICASFDDRIFLAGNPKLPNTVFFSQRDLTGYNNPTYFGVLNYNNLGTSNAPITALVPSANALYVLKDDSTTDPTMYVLTGQTTKIDLLPRIYTVESGLPGIGCKGAACNFLDDIVFMSKNGVIGIDKQAVNLERTLGDRSVLINGRLTREDPTKAVFAEWEGYLAVLFTNNGHLYLADSRAYTEGAGYEWYFVDSVGSWGEDTPLYKYSNEYVHTFGTDGHATVSSWFGTTFSVVERETVDETYYGDVQTVYTEPSEDGLIVILVETESGSNEYYQVKPTGEKVNKEDTVFYPATCMVSLNDRILFGTDDGKVLTFNTDKRGVQSSAEGSHNFAPDMIRPEWYTFCGHRIESYVETEDDDAGVANATKDTVKRSVVVDLKALLGSRYKVTTYTDRDNWQDGNAATGAINDYSNVGFGATNLKGDEHINVQIRERARKWVHKRYRVESNGFKAPFGLYRITYNFEINGRIK